MSDLPSVIEISSDPASGKRKAEEPIEPATVKRSAASSSSSKAVEQEDDSDQEDDDLDEDLDFLETSNIIHSGRRTRGVKIDFTSVPQDDLLDDDEEDAAVAPEVEDDDDEEEEDEEDEEEEVKEDKGQEKQGETVSATADEVPEPPEQQDS